MKIVILDGYTTEARDLNWHPIEALGDVSVYDRTAPDEVVSRSKGAIAVLLNKAAMTREAIYALPDLRYIGVLATGYNTVDTVAAAERGILVTHAAGYGSASVAQHVFSLILSFTNLVDLHATDVAAGGWTRAADWTYHLSPLTELAGKTLGVVGYGRIGQATADLGRAFGMHILAAGRTPVAGVEWTDMDELFSRSDVVSLHCPLTPETHQLVNARRLTLMQPHALLINTARGGLIDEADLAAALHAGRIGGAGLDVLSAEPPAADNPLLTAPRCRITPHIAWATPESRRRLLQIVANNLRAFQEGRVQNRVG